MLAEYPSKRLVEVGGDARPEDCQTPVNHIDKKCEEPKTQVFKFVPLSSACLSICRLPQMIVLIQERKDHKSFWPLKDSY